jgi:hypothetical protein
MESFFSRKKDELTSRCQYRSLDEARADAFDYIERFYNPRRRHSSLGGISPMEFDDIAIVPTFILTPLTYLGGVFYSVKLLPAWAETATHLNPIFYLVGGAVELEGHLVAIIERHR